MVNNTHINHSHSYPSLLAEKAIVESEIYTQLNGHVGKLFFPSTQTFRAPHTLYEKCSQSC